MTYSESALQKPATRHGIFQNKLHQNLILKKPWDERIEVARPGLCEHITTVVIFIQERSTARQNHGLVDRDYGSGARRCGISLLCYYVTAMGW